MIEKAIRKAIKSLSTDRSGEFIGDDFLAFCKKEGIHRELIVAYTPHQNGIAERKNCSIYLERHVA